MALTIPQAGLSADANITHYWTCDSNFNDSVGGANGTDTNTPTYVAGKFSNAFTCASASSQYTSVANSIFPWTSNTYWVHFWFKLASTGANQSFTMTFRTVGKGLLLYIAGGVITHSKPQVVDLNYIWTEDTSWHMLDCYGNGSGMKTFLDNVEVATNANPTVLADPDGDTITWGSYKSAGSLQAGWYLNGQLDDIAIFTRIPTSSEITKLYSNIPGGLSLMGVGT